MISIEEFDKLSMEEQKKYLIEQVDKMSNEQAKELYDAIMNDEEAQKLLKEGKIKS